MTISFGIIGTNEPASRLAEAISACEGTILHAVYDTNCIESVRFAEKTGAFVYSDLTAFLKDPQVQAVCIASPYAERAAHAVQAAQAGKHVLLERPMALSLQEADAILEACRQSGVKLGVVQPNRFHSAAVRLKKALEAGVFGKISHVNFTVRRSLEGLEGSCLPRNKPSRLDAGLLLYEAADHMDLMLWLVGGVEEVKAYPSDRRRPVITEDAATVRCRFESGALGIVEWVCTRIQGCTEDTAAVFGDKGTALLGGAAASRILRWNAGPVAEAGSEEQIRYMEEDKQGILGYRFLIKDMAEAIRTGRDPAVTGMDGRASLALLLSIQAAGRHNGGYTAASRIG